ncbi:hypothetical protein HYW53_03785 [Candidatus Giovannonibacteria bacterium]|nr:hypothetical protein [Candidatus Giovannonibacteria bacterium]
MNTLGIIAILVVLYNFPVVNRIMPFREEFQALLQGLIPYAPLLIGLWFLRDSLNTAAGGIGRAIETIAGFIGVALFTIFVLPLLIAVMLADTALLGSFSNYVWRNQAWVVALIIASAIGIYVAGGATREFIKRYFYGAVMVAVFGLVLGFIGSKFLGVEDIDFSVEGRVFPNPARSIEVRGGDTVKISMFGEVYKDGKVYGPAGDPMDPVAGPDGIPRGRGEVQLIVGDLLNPFSKKTAVPIEITEHGVQEIFGIDVGEWTGGYWAKGEAIIPAGVKGRVSLGFTRLDPPEKGWMKAKFQVVSSTGPQGFLNSLLKYAPYLVFLAILAFAIGVFGGTGALNAFVFKNAAWAQKSVWALAVIFFVGSLLFASIVGGVWELWLVFPEAGGRHRVSVGEGMGLKELCPGDEHWLDPGTEVTLQVGERHGCRVSAVTVPTSGKVIRRWIYPGGETEEAVLSSRDPDLPAPSRRPSAVFVRALERSSFKAH